MYNYLKYLFYITIITTIAFSQVGERTIEFNFGERNAFYLVLNDVDKNLVEDVWRSTNKNFGKTDKKKGEFLNEGVALNGLSNPVDWYMKLEKQKANVEIQLCVISNDEFVSSSNQPENAAVISTFLSDFAYTVQVAKVQAEYDKEKKELEKLQKSLKKVNGDIEKNNDLVDKNNKKIKKANKDIESNLKKQSELSEEITVQNTLVNNLLIDGAVPTENSVEHEKFSEENDKLGKKQNKLEKLVKDYDSLLKDIEKSTKKINKAEGELKSDAKEVDKLKKKIAKQGALVETIYKKLQAM